MYRTEYRRLGCIGWVLVAVVAGSLGAPLLMAPFALLFGSAQVGPYAPLFWVVAMLLMGVAFRRITTRFDKLARNFLAAVMLASTRLWLRAYESRT